MYSKRASYRALVCGLSVCFLCGSSLALVSPKSGSVWLVVGSFSILCGSPFAIRLWLLLAFMFLFCGSLMALLWPFCGPSVAGRTPKALSDSVTWRHNVINSQIWGRGRRFNRCEFWAPKELTKFGAKPARTLTKRCGRFNK